MNAYLRRFHERAIDYCDLVAEVILVDVCLYGMIEEFRENDKAKEFGINRGTSVIPSDNPRGRDYGYKN